VPAPLGAEPGRITAGSGSASAISRRIPRLTDTVRMCARLVRGRDTGGNFDLIPPPEAELHPAAPTPRAGSTRAIGDNCAGPIAAHEREFAAQPFDHSSKIRLRRSGKLRKFPYSLTLSAE